MFGSRLSRLAHLRRSLIIAPLLLVGLAAPSVATVPTVGATTPAGVGDVVQWQYWEITYYSDEHYRNQVGYASRGCDGSYVSVGYDTSYYVHREIICP